MVDEARLRELADRHYGPTVEALYGGEGVRALKRLMNYLHQLYAYVEPDRLGGALTLVSPLGDGWSFSDPGVVPTRHATPASTAADLETDTPTPSLVILEVDGPMVTSGGTAADTWERVVTDPIALSDGAVVYDRRDGEEYFYAAGERISIWSPNSIYASVFAVPTFRRLEDALHDYKRRSVRTSQCDILSAAWVEGKYGPRLLLKAKPEWRLRDSLAQYLQNVLRGTEVHTEQNVDDSKPVDVKVTWQIANRIAIIEVKWLGKSYDEETDTVSSGYTDVRAREGATQLADYLDRQLTFSPDRVTTGYLVVFDARRRGVTSPDSRPSRDDAFRYRHRDIEFNPDYHNLRNDFAIPIRMFAEPSAIHCSTP